MGTDPELHEIPAGSERRRPMLQPGPCRLDIRAHLLELKRTVARIDLPRHEILSGGSRAEARRQMHSPGEWYD